MASYFAGELVCLGVDALLFAFLWKGYADVTTTIQNILDAPVVTLNEDLVRSDGGNFPYAIVRGRVQPLGASLASQYSDDREELRGVIQRIVTVEHGKCLRSGRWCNSRRLLRSFVNDVPFGLAEGAATVEVTEWRKATRLDADVTFEKFEPSGVSGQVVGWLEGNVPDGTTTTERMLVQGTMLTGIGELVREDGKIRLQPPADGKEFFLVRCPYQSLVKDLEIDKRFYWRMFLVSGALGVMLLTYACHKFWKRRQVERAAHSVSQLLLQIREQREVSSQTSMEGVSCCVCLQNPREVSLVACGHACLCANCAIAILEKNQLCPLCRTKITGIERAMT